MSKITHCSILGISELSKKHLLSQIALEKVLKGAALLVEKFPKHLHSGMQLSYSQFLRLY